VLSVGIANRLRAEFSVVRIPVGAGSFLVSEPSSPNLGLSQAAPSRGVTGFFREVAKRPERELSTDNHLIMSLRMSEAVHLLTLYTFMVCVCVCGAFAIYCTS
jgi:hypothetical protein